PFWPGFDCIVPMQNRRVRDDRPGPEANTQNAREGEIEECHSRPQAEVIADPSNNDGHDGPTHNSSAQDSCEGAMMLGHRIESERNQDGPHHGCEKTNPGESNDRYSRRPE